MGRNLLAPRHLLTPRLQPYLTDAATMTGQETVTLQSSDSKTFELPKTAAEMSTLVKNLLEDVEEDGVVPLGNVNAKTLAKVIEYCKFHVENPAAAADDARKEAIKK